MSPTEYDYERECREIDEECAINMTNLKKENCENFDNGLTRVAPDGEFKSGKEIENKDIFPYGTNMEDINNIKTNGQDKLELGCGVSSERTKSHMAHNYAEKVKVDSPSDSSPAKNEIEEKFFTVEIFKGVMKCNPVEFYEWMKQEEKINFEKGSRAKQKEVLRIIEEEIIYPDYQKFKSPAEAITKFKIKLKNRIEQNGN